MSRTVRRGRIRCPTDRRTPTLSGRGCPRPQGCAPAYVWRPRPLLSIQRKRRALRGRPSCCAGRVQGSARPPPTSTASRRSARAPRGCCVPHKRDGCRICPANPQRTARRCGNRPHFPKALPAKRYRAKRGLRRRCRTGQSCTFGGNRCRADLAEEYAFRNINVREHPAR